MEPENVNPKNFEVKKIIYKNDGFSIAFGTTMKNGKKIEECLAMRWDGNNNFPKGYPSSKGIPFWFFIPKELTETFTFAINNFYNEQKKS